jgi:hypothetical protein
MTSPQLQRKRINIIQAMDDPNLFGKWFRGPSWAAWRVFLKALFALAMDADELKLFESCTGRNTPPTQQCTYAALIIGRRGGKTRILALIAVFLAAFFDWRPFLAPGETAIVACVAADKKQAAVLLKYIKGMLNEVPMLKRLVVRETLYEIELSTGVAIEIMAGDFRTVRGRTLVAGLVDELAFLPTDENSSSPDSEIITTLKPAMVTIPGAMMLVSSSPYARRGVLWRDYRRMFGTDIPDEICWKAPSRTMNPKITEAFVKAEIEKDPVTASAEYFAEFRSDIESYVAREVVEAAVVDGRFELAPSSNHRYVAGLDPSGGSGQDSMTLAIAYRDGDALVLAALREWRPSVGAAALTAVNRRPEPRLGSTS